MSDEEVERRLEELARAVDALVRIDRPGALRARGRPLRVRRRLVLATGVTGMAATVGVALAVAPGTGRGSADTTGASTGGVSVPATTGVPAPSSSARATSPATPTAAPTTPSSGATMLAGPDGLIGVTAEQAQHAWAACLAADAAAAAKMPAHTQAVNGVTMPPIQPRDADPSHYSILYALKITANPNEGVAGVGVLALAKDGKTVDYCRDRSDGWAGVKDYQAYDSPWSATTPVATDACNGEYDLCYPVLEVAPAPSTRDPFNWLDFGHTQADVKRVTVQYGGPQQDAVMVDGHWIASGTLTTPQSKAPRVRGFDASGKQVYDSMKDPHYDQTY
jgi:hypothetical protein